MRRRTLALTSASAVVAAMTVLPAISAAAAEPLVDGAYAFGVAGSTITVTVADGAPGDVTGLPDGWLVEFSFDAEGVLLNELVVTVPDGDDATVYDVTIDLLDGDEDGVVDDYTPTVVERLPDDEGTDPDEDVDEPQDVVEDPDEGDDDGEDPDEELDEQPEQEPDEVVEEPDELVEDDEAGADHGAIVSTVAACAPRGREARDAGLPNHGYFVSAAARGESVTWTLVDDTGAETVLEADLTTLDGATAFCAAVTSGDTDQPSDEPDEDPVDEDVVDGARGDATGSTSTEQADVDGADDRRGPPEGRGRDKGRGGPPQGVPGRGPRG